MSRCELSKLLSLALLPILGLTACQGGGPVAATVNVAAAAAEDRALQADTEREMQLESQYADANGMIDESRVADSRLFGQPPKGDLENFGEVLPGHIYRGARPSEKGVQMLRDKGVKLIISLENRKQVVATEKAWAEKYGMRFISIPLGIIKPPSVETVQGFLKLVTDSANQPVYFHCMQGRDRTGTMGLAYRVSVDHWKFDQAYTEMKQYGFHRYLLGLNAFVRWYADHYGSEALAALTPAR